MREVTKSAQDNKKGEKEFKMENTKITLSQIKEAIAQLSEQEKITLLQTSDINICKISGESKTKIVYNMFYDKKYNIVNLDSLYFGDKTCDVVISNMTVKGSLNQSCQNVGKDLYQYGCCVGGNLEQSCQEVAKRFETQTLADDEEYNIEYTTNNGEWYKKTTIVKKRVEMTLEEVEEKLGYRIKIR